MHRKSDTSHYRHLAARSSYTIALLVFGSLPTVFVPSVVASGGAPAEIQGCWNLMTGQPLRITLKFGESSSIAYVKVDDSHELEKEFVDFSDEKWVFWHPHVKDDATYETWEYRCEDETKEGSVVALRCVPNFTGESLYFPSCSF
jgi:hypothetical protein